jgi:hypothetical protein
MDAIVGPIERVEGLSLLVVLVEDVDVVARVRSVGATSTGAGAVSAFVLEALDLTAELSQLRLQSHDFATILIEGVRFCLDHVEAIGGTGSD